MNQSHFLGKTVYSFKNNGDIGPIEGVVVVVDSEHEYAAYANEDKSGYILTVECPRGTKQMAEDILAKVSGKTYKSFEATGAQLPIETELGDSLIINGVSAFLGYQQTRFSQSHMSDISAPGDNEVDHEYPYIGTAERAAKKAEAEVNRQKVLINGLEGISVIDKNGAITKIRGDGIDTTTLTVSSAQITGELSAHRLKGTEVALRTADDAFGNWGPQVGSMIITNADSSDYALEIRSFYAARFGADDGNLFLFGGYNNGYYGTYIGLLPDSSFVEFKGHLIPNSDIVWDFGGADRRLGNIYAVNGTIQTSDRNQKNSIEDLPQKYVDFVLWLAAKRYKMNDGNSGRYHVGFIAQDVEEGMGMFGIDPLEFGGFVKDKGADGRDVYMLRYEEFIAIILGAVQRQQETIKDHEDRLRKLEAMISGG